MAEQEQNRSETATPFKLREARKRGQVPKGMDVTTVMLMATALAVLLAWGEQMIRKQLELSYVLFDQAGKWSFSADSISGRGQDVVFTALAIMAPWFVALIIAAIVANLMQSGPVLSFHPLKPDFARINPAQGFKRFFSIRIIYELIKSLLKLFILGAVVYLAIKSLLPHLFGYLQTDPKTYGRWGMADMAGLLFKLILAFLFIALLDLMYSKWEFGKNMRMSRRELKEEIKQREGDPRIRARIRQLQNELRKKAQGMQKLPKADVLITNPTHIAVALRYERGVMDAPQLVAKGSGELTTKMKEIARKHHIPIIENRTLARALFQKTNIDQTIPGDLYPEVAKLLVWVYAMRDRRLSVKAA